MVANINDINFLLKQKGLNVTGIRRKVLELLRSPGIALTQKEIEEQLEQDMGQVDRVTVYRTIRTLVEKKIIHQIAIDSQTVKYKLAGKHINSAHAHFHCSHCNKLICMPQVDIKEDTLPGGFVMESSSLIIEGICAHCNLPASK